MYSIRKEKRLTYMLGVELLVYVKRRPNLVQLFLKMLPESAPTFRISSCCVALDRPELALLGSLWGNKRMSRHI